MYIEMLRNLVNSISYYGSHGGDEGSTITIFYDFQVVKFLLLLFQIAPSMQQLLLILMFSGYTPPQHCPPAKRNYGTCRAGRQIVTYITYHRPVHGGRCRPRFFRKSRTCGRLANRGCVCTATGDPHYRTFDGQTFPFYGHCKYLLAKSARSLHAGCQWNVQGKNEMRNNNPLAFLRFLDVQLGEYIYRLHQHRRLEVQMR